MPGALFTSYLRDAAPPARRRRPATSVFGWDDIRRGRLRSTIGGERVGTLYIRRDLGDMYARLRVGARDVVGLLLLAIRRRVPDRQRMQRLDRLAAARARRHGADDLDDAQLLAARDAASTTKSAWSMRAFNEMLDRMAEALERERSANRLKDEFLATLSHELRTPLNAVLGWTRMLRSARLDPATQAKALETIERNARAQARLIEDLLDMSRSSAASRACRCSEADLAAIVDAAVEVIRPAAAAKRLQLHVEIAARPALTHRRCGTPAAGRLEPAVERRQVHAAGRAGLGSARARRRLSR